MFSKRLVSTFKLERHCSDEGSSSWRWEEEELLHDLSFLPRAFSLSPTLLYGRRTYRSPNSASPFLCNC